MDLRNTVIFSTESSRYFADLIAKRLGFAVTEIVSKPFGNGEQYYRLEIDDRTELFGKDVIFVGSTHTDEDIEMLYRVGCALAKFGTRRRIFVVPYLGYSTMERGTLPGEVVTAKTVMRKFSSIPNSGMGNVFLFMDLHVGGLVHYLEGDCIGFELYAQPILEEGIDSLEIPAPFVFGSADLGRPSWVRTFAKKYGTRLVLVDKDREGERSSVTNVIGDVSGTAVVIYDDMLRSGGSFVHAAEAYRSHGATEMYGIVSHLALNNHMVVKLVDDSPIRKIVTTNTHPMSQTGAARNCAKLDIRDVSGVFSEQIIKLLKNN